LMEGCLCWSCASRNEASPLPERWMKPFDD